MAAAISWRKNKSAFWIDRIIGTKFRKDRYLHLHHLRRNNQTHPRAPLLPHRDLRLIAPRQSALHPALPQQRIQGIEIPHVVPGPVLEPRLHDLQFEGEQALEDVLARFGGLDGVEHGEEVGAFRGGLVEEP